MTWANDRLDIAMIPVEGRNHATLISNPDDAMVQLVADFLKIDGDEGFDAWNQRALEVGSEARKKMCMNPGKDAAGIGGDVGRFFGHLFPSSESVMEGWQQFGIHARDERGDGVSDYLIDVLREIRTAGGYHLRRCARMCMRTRRTRAIVAFIYG